MIEADTTASVRGFGANETAYRRQEGDGPGINRKFAVVIFRRVSRRIYWRVFGDFCQGVGGTAEQFIGYGCRLISPGPIRYRSMSRVQEAPWRPPRCGATHHRPAALPWPRRSAGKTLQRQRVVPAPAS